MSADRQKENAAEYQKSVAIFKEAFDKTVNVFIGLKGVFVLEIQFQFQTDEFNELIEKNYTKQKIPSIEHLIRQTSYFFVNSHPLFDFTRPVPEKVKFFGGIATPTAVPKEHVKQIYRKMLIQ